MSRKEFKQLTLAEKVDLIKNSDGRSGQSLAQQYGVSRATVYNVLKRKADLMQAYEDNEPANKKRATVCRFEVVNEFIWTWFCQLRASNVPVSGPMIKEKAISYAKEQGFDDFKASTGWLDKLKIRHNINCAVVCGEGAAVNPETITDWKERLSGITDQYEPKDIFNMDETGIFFRALPEKTLRVRGTDCLGGKKSKERLTAMFCVNMTGEEFEKPLIIGRAEKPRCFRNINTKTLPVLWRHNKKAWMTSNLFKEWVLKFNEKMKRLERKVLLFLDNATCHPNIELSNVKLVYFPPNTTSNLQPLDQGIIKTMKSFYRQMLLRRVIKSVEDGLDPAQVAISVLDACIWIADAVKRIRPESIVACFNRCGFSKTSIPEIDHPEDDMPLADLVRRYQRATGSAPETAPEYLNCDNELATTDVDGSEDATCDDADGELEEDPHDVPPQLISTKQAIEITEKLRDYLYQNDMSDYAQTITKLNTVSLEKSVTSSRQMDLSSFFKR